QISTVCSTGARRVWESGVGNCWPTATLAQEPFFEHLNQEEKYMTRRIPQIMLALAIIAPYASLHSQGMKAFNGFELVDKSGNINKPADYRDQYELLGTYTVIDPKGNQMHVTYASPGTAAYYRKTGKFPDGAVLVKEIFLTDHATLTTGDAHWASQLVQWFVQIKDTKNSYPTNPLR